MQQLKDIVRSGALRPVLVIWAFGYLLVDIFVYLMGRMPLGVSTVASIPLFILGVTYTLLLERWQQHLSERASAVRWGGLGVALLLATAVHGLFDLHYFKWLAMVLVPDWQRWAMDITPERIFTVSLLYLWTFCLALTLLWAAGVGNKAERAAARATLFEAEKQRAEAAALRLQLNPHFLFNTLNSIASLVTLDRRAEAEAMIERLADFLRASLEADPMADVPLSQELDAVEAYLGIEAARFGERLTIAIDVEPAALEHHVPNFILQPLVENAIKHGVASVAGPANLSVTASVAAGQLVLSVVNAQTASAGKAAARVSRTGIGLPNIRQRLRIIYGPAASLSARAVEGGYEAVMRLPLAGAGLAPAKLPEPGSGARVDQVFGAGALPLIGSDDVGAERVA